MDRPKRFCLVFGAGSRDPATPRGSARRAAIRRSDGYGTSGCGGQPHPSRQASYRGRLLDRFWRTIYRVGFPLARIWWSLRRPPHEGALVAVYVGEAVLLVRSSYRKAWNFPGGGVRPGESPEGTARRELAEEVGLVAHELVPAGEARGIWDGRQDRVHFFELRLDGVPELHLDNREIVAAQLMMPGELGDIALTGPVAAYLRRDTGAGPVDPATIDRGAQELPLSSLPRRNARTMPPAPPRHIPHRRGDRADGWRPAAQ